MPFLGYGSRSQERLDPYPSLSAMAAEHSAFHTPAEEGARERPLEAEESWEDRLTRLEAGMLKVQQSMQALLDGAPVTAVSGTWAQAGRAPLSARLDPAVVEAARTASVPEDQLIRMSQLASKGAKLQEQR